ncbi:hypothetical protein A4X09_0g384 [Tilletia walkeri]|uniref:Uncharacterized protein n=1 Tax=Tilletia walkeri TaxID=117179 RepID=A0A8X7NH44_9BASI|nr:hypothetical protein A4X09_0g384 [Tilletia walkeri]
MESSQSGSIMKLSAAADPSPELVEMSHSCRRDRRHVAVALTSASVSAVSAVPLPPHLTIKSQGENEAGAEPGKGTTTAKVQPLTFVPNRHRIVLDPRSRPPDFDWDVTLLAFLRSRGIGLTENQVSGARNVRRFDAQPWAEYIDLENGGRFLFDKHFGSKALGGSSSLGSEGRDGIDDGEGDEAKKEPMYREVKPFLDCMTSAHWLRIELLGMANRLFDHDLFGDLDRLPAKHVRGWHAEVQASDTQPADLFASDTAALGLPPDEEDEDRGRFPDGEGGPSTSAHSTWDLPNSSFRLFPVPPSAGSTTAFSQDAIRMRTRTASDNGVTFSFSATASDRLGASFDGGGYGLLVEDDRDEALIVFASGELHASQ